MKVLIWFVLGYLHKFCGFVITYSKMSHLSFFLTSLTLHFFSPYIILIGNVLQLKYLERKNDFLNTTVTSRPQKRKYCTWTVSFWCAIVWTVIFFAIALMSLHCLNVLVIIWQTSWILLEDSSFLFIPYLGYVSTNYDSTRVAISKWVIFKNPPDIWGCCK